MELSWLQQMCRLNERETSEIPTEDVVVQMAEFVLKNDFFLV